MKRLLLGVSIALLTAVAASPPALAAKPAQSKCAGSKVTIRGTDDRDLIRATRERDVIAGLGGADRILRVAPSDLVCGGAGADQLRARPADLRRAPRSDKSTVDDSGQLAGGIGADTFILGCPSRPEPDSFWGWSLGGGPGDDLIDVDCGGVDQLGGGDGADTIRFGNGYDVIEGGAGEDLLRDDYSRGDECQPPPNPDPNAQHGCHPACPPGYPMCDGMWAKYDDEIFGGAGDDKLVAGPGPDFVIGDNTIDDVTGDDDLYGGAGDDALVGGPGHDRCDGGPGDGDYNGTFSSFESMQLPYDCEETESVENPPLS